MVPGMTDFAAANLIRLFDFYLALMFLLGLSRRYPLYWNTLCLLINVRGRWPKLMERMKQHHNVLLTGEVLRPLIVAVALMIVQFFCSRLLFPNAKLQVSEVFDDFVSAALILVGSMPMFAVDLYFLIYVGRFDRNEAEKYMDQAESWLGGWKGSAVRYATLGYVDPRKVVDREVRKSLVQLGKTVSWAAWWVSIQVVCRTVCGLTIWLLWAFTSRESLPYAVP